MGFLGEELHVKIICEDKKQKLYSKSTCFEVYVEKISIKMNDF